MATVPFIILPFLFGVGAYRLFKLFFRLRNGELQFNRQRGIALPLLTVLAYITFASFTLSICVAYAYVVWALFLPEFPFAKIPLIFCIVVAYPVIYFFAEWVFYYGLKPNEKGVQ